MALVAIGDLALQGPTSCVTAGDRDPIQDSGDALGTGLTIVTMCLLACLLAYPSRARSDPGQKGVRFAPSSEPLGAGRVRRARGP